MNIHHTVSQILIALGTAPLLACDPSVSPEPVSAPATEASDDADTSGGQDESDPDPDDGCNGADEPPGQGPADDQGVCDLESFEQDARVVTLSAAGSAVRAQIPFVLELPTECAAGADLAGAGGTLYEAGLSILMGLEEDASTLEPTDVVSVEMTTLHVKRLELYRRSFERDLAVLSCDEGALWTVECTKILTNQWVCIPTTNEELQKLKDAGCDCPVHWQGQCLCDQDHSSD